MDTKKMLAVGVCPWCQSPVNAGAAACKSCGASEVDGWKAFGSWRLGIWIISLGCLVPAGLIVLFFSPMIGVLLLALSIGVPVVIRMLVKDNHSWMAGGARSLV